MIGRKMWVAFYGKSYTQAPVLVSGHFSEQSAGYYGDGVIPGRFLTQAELEQVIRKAVEMARGKEAYNLHDRLGHRLEAERTLPPQMRTFGFAAGTRERSVDDIVKELLK